MAVEFSLLHRFQSPTHLRLQRVHAMTPVINLRQARKARKRRDKDEQARHNRAAFGRTKAEKLASATTRQRDDRYLDGHKLPEDGSTSHDR